MQPFGCGIYPPPPVSLEKYPVFSGLRGRLAAKYFQPKHLAVEICC